MEPKDVKKAYEDAQKDLREKQINEVKAIVMKTLEKIEALKKAKEEKKKELQEIEKKEKLLKLDIDDLKEGRLDRMQERQEKDPEAKKISVVLIIKEKETIVERERPTPWWYWPYQVTWNQYVDAYSTKYLLTNTNSNNMHTLTYGGNSDIYDCCVNNAVSLNGSIAKDNAIGTYVVYGNTVHLR